MPSNCFFGADSSKIHRFCFFRTREREGGDGEGRRAEGGDEGQGREQQQRQRRPRTPDPKKLLKSRGGARRNRSSDTRAQAAQGAPAGRSKQGLRRLQEGTQPRAPQGRNGDEIEQDRCRSRAAARRGGKGWSERTRERRSRRASGAETSRRREVFFRKTYSMPTC